MKTIIQKLFLASKILLISIPSVINFNANAATEYQPIEWNVPSSRFSEFGLDPEKVANITNGGQFAIVSNPHDFTFWNARTKEQQHFTNKRIIYVVTVIDAPVEELRQMVWDIGEQDNFSPLLNDTTNISTKGNVRIGSYEQSIKLPIIKLVSDFVVQINKHDNGDIGMILIDEGDVESMYQYWEFFPLSENKTLTVLSGWQDTDSASFVYKVVLNAEPALEKVFPILTTYERLRQFRNEATRRHPELAPKEDDNIYDIRSANGYLGDNKALDLQELKKLAQLGSVQFYQAARKLSYDGGIHDIRQVTAIQYIPLNQNIIQPLLNDFSSLVEYNELTYGWFDTESTGEDWAFLELAVKIGPLKMPVDIYLIQEEVDRNKMLFYTADHAFMYPLIGNIEYVKIPNNADDPNDDGTIVAITFGGVVGPEASFVFKMTRYLPFHNVLIAATYGTVTSDSMTDWVVNRVAENRLKANEEKVVGNF